ncbi:PAAR-like domain-containing protein [Vibrio sp. 10N.261.46.E11]|uniref:PAAR-like domain-containing protein n=1 Tax=Vibrio sp. 10N.261.46.E11 TaxID=3229662 RepID=UPI0035517D33
MAVTISANGLSVVHKGSGGEANATLPDVCLTTVGNSVVPIPYGNNAKSADLVEGTTTVSADGGNSIALKGSKFAKSTGDAGGDKKGVASGTIESEAEFISASPNVIIEGKGVARLSDQMTMNKANTMCLGGVQNPAVTVTEDEEGTYTVYVKARYPDGVLLKNADFDITDVSGGALSPGHFDNSGKSKVSGLKPGQIKILAKESTDEFIATPVRITNPHYLPDYNDDDFFDRSAQGQQTFWHPNRIAPPVEGWGTMGPSLTADRYFADIVKAETKAHFEFRHPSFQFGILAESLIAGIDSLSNASFDSVLANGLPMVIDEGEILSVLFRLPRHETADRMLAYMRARGKGNPQVFINSYPWDKAKNTLNSELEGLLSKIKGRVESLKSEASRLNYVYLSSDIYEKHVSTIDTYAKKLSDNLSQAFKRMENKASQLMNDVSGVSVIQAPDHVYSAEAGTIEVVVNAIPKIDLEEQKWVKVRAIYSDRWQTPIYAQNLKITANSVVHEENASLNALPLNSTESETIELAVETNQVEGGVAVFDTLKPNTDSVTVEFVGEPSIEKQIVNIQDSVEATLDGTYNALTEDMKEFQQQWDEEGYWTLGDGVIDGAQAWGADIVDMLSPRFWGDAADTISDLSSSAVDKLAIYSVDKFNSITKAMLNEKGQLKNPTWVLETIGKEFDSFQDSVFESADEAIEDVSKLYAESQDVVRKLECIAKHRQTILELPQKISNGDVDAVETFVDTVLMELDPEWAQEIKGHEQFPNAMAIIEDHDTILTYVTYLSLMLEAIPPNFYFYYGGKAGTYLILELILTVVLAIFTLGTGATARIATLVARFAGGAKKVKGIRNAAKALDSFIKAVESLIDVLSDYQELAEKLVKRPLGKFKGKPVTTMTAKKKAVKRDASCRLCHSNQHKTPRYKRGELEYI